MLEIKQRRCDYIQILDFSENKNQGNILQNSHLHFSR